jgi:hypothetical protein
MAPRPVPDRPPTGVLRRASRSGRGGPAAFYVFSAVLTASLVLGLVIGGRRLMGRPPTQAAVASRSGPEPVGMPHVPTGGRQPGPAGIRPVRPSFGTSRRPSNASTAVNDPSWASHPLFGTLGVPRGPDHAGPSAHQHGSVPV